MKPAKSYFVCTTGRTGSGLLCSSLWQTELAGRPDEFFSGNVTKQYAETWKSTGYLDYLDHAIEFATTENGVFGAKVKAEQIADIEACLGDAGVSFAQTGLDFMLAKLPESKFVWLRRRDTIRQAISLWKARRTGAFNLRSGGPRPGSELPFDRQAIDDDAEKIKKGDAIWHRFFQDRHFAPLELFYEDHLESNWQQTVGDVCRFLAIDLPDSLEIQTDYHRQSDAHSEDMYRRYTRISGAR